MWLLVSKLLEEHLRVEKLWAVQGARGRPLSPNSPKSVQLVLSLPGPLLGAHLKAVTYSIRTYGGQEAEHSPLSKTNF